MVSQLDYQRLDPSTSDFRLLTILPTTDESEPISCTLDTYRLAEPPPYHALSYVWGDATVTVDIHINDATFQATMNLENALRAIRSRRNEEDDLVIPSLGKQSANSAGDTATSPWDGAYRIWVDAVCINQADVTERNAQVLRMREIYSKAVATVAWLGLPADRSEVAFNLMRILVEKEQNAQYTEIIKTENNRFVYLWVALAKLLDREYWTRCWILQEVALAREVYFLCGSEATRISTMTTALYGAQFRHEDALEALGYPNQNAKLPRTVMLKIVWKLQMKKMAGEARRQRLMNEQGANQTGTMNISEQDADEIEKRRLERLAKYQPFTPLHYITVEKSRARLKSSVLHDQLYSLLGLCEDAETLLPHPNYEESFQTISQDMYQRLTEKTQSLDWIRFSSGNEPLNVPTSSENPNGSARSNGNIVLEDEQEKAHRTMHYEKIMKDRVNGIWPSWLPDNCKSFGCAVHGNAMVEGCGYAATKDQTVEYKFKDKVLSCRGIIFDTIAPRR